MTLTLTGYSITYRQYVKEYETIIEIYDYYNKAAFKLIEGDIKQSIGKPIRVTLRKYEVIPYLENYKNLIIVGEKKVNKQLVDYIPFPKPENKKIENGCHNCTHHNYDWYPDDGYGGEEFEICEKGNDLEGPCPDWEEL